MSKQSMQNSLINHLKPTGHVMHQHVLTFNNFMLCPHCTYVFRIYLRTNSDVCHLQHKLIGFYNRDEKCLLCRTNWVFKLRSMRFGFQWLRMKLYLYCYSTRYEGRQLRKLQKHRWRM